MCPNPSQSADAANSANSKRFVKNESQGKQGETYKYTTPTGAIFFVKDTSVACLAGDENGRKLGAQTDFAILKIMSLLGLKVPTELALIETVATANSPARSILIKRAVADQESNKKISENPENYSDLNIDWYIRRAFVFRVLKIHDIDFRTSHNTTKIEYLEGKKDCRFIDYDPDVNSFLHKLEDDLAKICHGIYGDLSFMGKSFKFDLDIFKNALGKTKFYLEENKTEIFAALAVIKNTQIQDNIKEDLQQVSKLLEDVTPRAISPDKAYVSRRVAAQLDIEDLADEFQKETAMTLDINPEKIEYYSVSAGSLYKPQKPEIAVVKLASNAASSANLS